jgi:pyruvate/2-oxoglutarate dehydrogenase complex dihydrolipoamide acyltransferase (E2) component
MAYRKDRDVTRETPHYRRILLHLTPDRDSAVVFFQQDLDLTKTLPWLEARSKATGQKLTFLHFFIAAAGRMLNEHPRLNRYAAGWHIYERDGVNVTVSAKKELTDGAKLVMLKVPIAPTDGVDEVAAGILERLKEGRSGTDLPQEREVSAFLHVPGFILAVLIRCVLWLERRHWLPGFFVDPDPMYSSLVVANLGSVGLNAAYHHLYEYGNCTFFCTIGRIADRPVAVDGQIEIRRMVEVRYTFDERAEDGLACALALAGLKELVEDPERWAAGPTDLGGKPPACV